MRLPNIGGLVDNEVVCVCGVYDDGMAGWWTDVRTGCVGGGFLCVWWHFIITIIPTEYVTSRHVINLKQCICNQRGRWECGGRSTTNGDKNLIYHKLHAIEFSPGNILEIGFWNFKWFPMTFRIRTGKLNRNRFGLLASLVIDLVLLLAY